VTEGHISSMSFLNPKQMKSTRGTVVSKRDATSCNDRMNTRVYEGPRAGKCESLSSKTMVSLSPERRDRSRHVD
jgi:hypothetical protein